MKPERCSQYTGLACIDGNCPIANAEEYAERCIPLVEACENCYYFKGCEDCYFHGTVDCKKLDKRMGGGRKR